MATTHLSTPILRRIQSLLARAQRAELRTPTAMTVATADQHGRPSVRSVLLKEVDTRGLVFFTNLRSRKARQLAENPRAALCLFWDPLAEQVTVEGRIEAVSDEEADAYWATRPRRSQLGAHASAQSQPLASRRVLVTQVLKLALAFKGRPIPRPTHWGGYRVVPDRVEFWKAGPFRLNERVLYQRQGGVWTRTLLYP